MSRRGHAMPFGAQLQPDGTVRFRLWAPAAARVELCLDTPAGERLLALHAAGNGWYQLTTDAAAPGGRYRYRIDGELRVPDPASRFQPDTLHGLSEVVDPLAFDWQDDDWLGRAWHEAVIYELHAGTFSADGDYAAIERRLDYLMDLGITAIELMPLAAFPGRRNWGYDGALLYAPDASYGRPEDLKHLVQSAHQRGLMVLLDVVYNHFGPDGNYLHHYAPAFFTTRHQTPWGAAINFDGADSAVVRDFFIHNALYWLDEFHLDGLRLDAVHAIADDSRPDILEAIADAVHEGPGASRQIHLVLENDLNAARYLRPDRRGVAPYRAQWNDDFHHAAHLLATGESDGYYVDYADLPLRHLGRTLTEGFAYQGEASGYRGGTARGEPSGDLPADAFVAFLQNHDQVGNRALGERITALAPREVVRALTAVLLFAPSPPLLFMGQEFAAASPFLFFCDFEGELAQAVTAGRRREFAHFARFSDPRSRQRIPDPNAFDTFARSRLDWEAPGQGAHADWLAWHRHLLNQRGRRLVPHLAAGQAGGAGFRLWGENGLLATWPLAEGRGLRLLANLGDTPSDPLPCPLPADRQVLHVEGTQLDSVRQQGHLPRWTVLWWLEHDGAA